MFTQALSKELKILEIVHLTNQYWFGCTNQSKNNYFHLFLLKLRLFLRSTEKTRYYQSTLSVTTRVAFAHFSLNNML